MNGLIINDKIYTLSEVEARLLLHFITETKATSEPTVPTKSVPTKSALTKSEYVYKKDFVAEYEVVKNTSVDGQTLYCIRNKAFVGKQKKVKKLVNNSIKALDGIITIRVKGEKTYSAWGYKKKSDAEKAMATLPTVFKAEDINKVVL